MANVTMLHGGSTKQKHKRSLHPAPHAGFGVKTSPTSLGTSSCAYDYTYAYALANTLLMDAAGVK